MRYVRRALPRLGERQMDPKKISIIIAIGVIATGVAWLFNNLGVLPAIEWFWTLGLAVCGLLIVVMLGFDKVTVVIGPFLIIGAIFSVIRQLGGITLSYELPLLFIILGVLLLIAVIAPLPSPHWLLEDEEDPR
jgi:hypothetical protein